MGWGMMADITLGERFGERIESFCVLLCQLYLVTIFTFSFGQAC